MRHDNASSHTLQRYEWEDRLIESHALALIAKEPVATALFLSRQFNWDPRDGGKPSLRWANKLAAESVGIPRSTFMKHLKVLKQEGFLAVERNNLVPALPSDHDDIKRSFQTLVADLSEVHGQGLTAQRRDFLSHIDNSRASSGTAESSNEDSFTEDSCSEDLCTDDSFTDTGTSHAAPSGAVYRTHREDPLPFGSSKGKTSLSCLASWWRRTASKTPSAASRESEHVRM